MHRNQTHTGRANNSVGRVVSRFMAVVLTVMVVAAIGAVPADAQATRPAAATTAEAEFLQMLNAERARAGLPGLQSHSNLVRDARAWSGVMAQQNRMFHTSTLGQDTARSIPTWQRAGENVGRGWNPQNLHRLFVESPTHYANITGDFNFIGVGVVYTADRTYVTFRFAKAPASTVVAGISSVSPTIAAAQVRRLYLAFFKREPDAGGSAFWVDKMVNGYPLGQISTEFIKSAEFVSTYGHLTDGGFITMVYRNVLGRTPDKPGYDYWVRQMANGMGRGSVMVNFSESAEFKSMTS